VYEVPEHDLRDYLGRKGLGIKIFYDRLKDRLAEVDPLGPDNLLIFSNGVLLSTGAPCSARFEVVTKSPLTGLMVGSSCGGPFGEAAKTAGWDGVIISGKAEAPTTVRIDSEGASFEDATHLWGETTHHAQEKLVLSPREGAAVIGPAGENLVLYANICSATGSPDAAASARSWCEKPEGDRGAGKRLPLRAGASEKIRKDPAQGRKNTSCATR
jgi:aldehyde:ferredoxin oxidoreductase